MIVATWNLENLYLPGGEFGPRDQAAYDAKLDALAATIGAIAPDVLAVQEVGDPAALDELGERVGGTWHVALSTLPDDRGIRVGFIARAPLDDVTEFRAFPERLAPVQVEDDGEATREMGRGGLAVRAGGITLATCHLKSKLLSFPRGANGKPRFDPKDEGERARYAVYALTRRAAEAATVRAAATALLGDLGKQRRLIVLGDLNDVPEAATVRGHADTLLPGSVIVLGDLNDDVEAATTQLLLGPPGSEIGTPGFDRPDQGDARRLWNLAPLIPAERRYTRIYRGRRELIDHVLASKPVLDRVTRVDTAATDLPSVTEEPSARRDAPGSDHAPVVVELSA